MCCVVRPVTRSLKPLCSERLARPPAHPTAAPSLPVQLAVSRIEEHNASDPLWVHLCYPDPMPPSWERIPEGSWVRGGRSCKDLDTVP